MDKVRLGSIGLGWWGGALAAAAESTGKATIAGCYARTLSKRDSFAAEYKCEPHDSLDALLGSDIDGVLIATPHTTHVELVAAAAIAGKHIFVDKPLTLTLAEADEAVAAVEEAGVSLQVGHNRRRQPANRNMSMMVESGDLGDLIEVIAVHHAPLLLNPDLANWRRQNEESPAGGMTALGVHQVDTFHYLAGPIRRVVAGSEKLREQDEVDTVTTVDVVFDSGAMGHLSTSMATGPVVDVTIHGTEAVARNSQDGARLTVQPRGTFNETAVPLPELDTLADQLSEFVAVVKGEASPETGAKEGRDVVAVLEAIVSSLASGSWEDVDYGRP